MVSATTDRRLGLAGNTAYKVPATVVATANITQSGEQTIDGIACLAVNAAGVPDRVLCVGMTDTTKNGLWDVQTSAWTRSIDANGNYDLVKGTQVYIARGTNAGLIYVLSTANPITIGTTAQTWIQSLTSGFLALLATAAGSTLMGWIQAGIGAVLRTVSNKLRESVSVDDFGAVGDNVTDDSAAIIAAQAALVVRGGGTLLYTFGKTYRLISASIPHANGVTHKGTGKATTDSNGASMGARIVSSAVDIFVNTGAINAGLTFKDLWIESQAGGGHIFNWTGAGLVAKVEIDGCLLFQKNAAKSVINGAATNGVFSIWAHHFEYEYLVGNTVPAINIVSNTVNSITFEDFWSICSSGATSGTYSIWIESTNAGGAAFNVAIKKVVFEVPGGGAINLLSCRNSTLEDCGVYDLVTTPNNPIFKIAKGATGPVSANVSTRRIKSSVGTAAKPDLQIDCSVGGQAGFVVEHCTLTWFDQVSANGAGCTHISNTISNYENSAFTEIGAGAGLDLRWVSQAASAHTYSIWNGFPGSNNGYLNFYQDGVYQGAFSPTGLLQWGGTNAAPAFYVSLTGQLNLKGPVYPSNAASPAVDQLACGIRAGSGVPNNATGNNGDVYFRSDTPATANQRVYNKQAGAWVGIL